MACAITALPGEFQRIRFSQTEPTKRNPSLIQQRRQQTSHLQQAIPLVCFYCAFGILACCMGAPIAAQQPRFRTPQLLQASSRTNQLTEAPVSEALATSGLGMKPLQRPATASSTISTNHLNQSMLGGQATGIRPEYEFRPSGAIYQEGFVEQGSRTTAPPITQSQVSQVPSDSPFLPLIKEDSPSPHGGVQSTISDNYLDRVGGLNQGIGADRPDARSRTGQDEIETLETLPPELSGMPDQTTGQGHEEILQYYPDGKLRIRRFVKQDTDGNYVKDGPWIYYDRNKRVVAAGRYRDGIMHGQWRRLHNGDEGGLFATKPFNLYQGGQFESIANFDRGQLDGAWTIKDQFRRTVFEINYVKGQRHGQASWWYPNGAKMRSAMFKEGLLDGAITEWDEGERPLNSHQYVAGRRVIRNTTFYRPQVPKTENHFLDEKMEPEGDDNWWDAKPTKYVSTGLKIQNGPSLEWFPNGQRKKRGAYKNDSPIGLFTWWHENGNKQIEGGYKDGLKAGRWTWWHENGMKSIEGTYDDDQPIGVWRAWYSDGQLRKEETFSLGEEISALEPVQENEDTMGETNSENEADPNNDTEQGDSSSSQELPNPNENGNDESQDTDSNTAEETGSNSTDIEEIVPLEFRKPD